MKLAIMQPYLFPYIGYWQLIHAVDKFVILDDVNYIKRGYINRNSILINGNPYKFTIPIKKATQNKLIMETQLNFDEQAKQKFLLMLQNAYKKAPYYGDVMPIMEQIINNPEEDLTAYIYNSLIKIAKYLQIDTEFLISSQIEKNNNLRAQDRIIEICKRVQTDVYINSCGGRELYDHESFKKEGMKLLFLDTRGEKVIYNQKNDSFEKNLSIIDVMMFNDIKTIRQFLEEYDLND